MIEQSSLEYLSDNGSSKEAAPLISPITCDAKLISRTTSRVGAACNSNTCKLQNVVQWENGKQITILELSKTWRMLAEYKWEKREMEAFYIKKVTWSANWWISWMIKGLVECNKVNHLLLKSKHIASCLTSDSALFVRYWANSSNTSSPAISTTCSQTQPICRLKKKQLWHILLRWN